MKITALIVTYNPDLDLLTEQINALVHQVEDIVIVDNLSENIEQITAAHIKQKIIRLEQNFGIGYAQNIGLEYCLERNVDYVILLDQDSLPSTNLIDGLLKAIQVNKATLAGPTYRDSRTKTTSFFVTEKNGIPFRWLLTENICRNDCVDAAFLIASGTLINLQDIKSAGGVRSDYFIDHVDTEWCFRLRARGHSIIGVPSAIMEHSLGDEVKKIWFFGWRQVSYHSPLRDYYMFRNTLLMLRDTQMPFIWKSHFTWRLVQFAGYFLTFAPLKKERLIKMSLGIIHGLKNIRGKLDPKTHTCQTIPKTSIDPT